jgi:hypothetical protein
MSSSGMLRRLALVRTDVSEEPSVSIRVTRIGELGTTRAATSNRRTIFLRWVGWLIFTDNVVPACHPDDGGDMFLLNVGSYKSHTA